MGGQDVLHLGAVDVLAAGDDHVLLAVDDPDVALVVLTNQVTGVEPAAGERLGGGLRVVPVARHQTSARGRRSRRPARPGRRSCPRRRSRADTVGMTLPTEPSLRIASSPNNMQVTGDISVCPNAARICVPGKVSAISRSSVSDAGAAPQDSTRSLRSRGLARCAAHTACHCAGTRKIPVTCSASQHVEQRAGVERAQRVEHRRPAEQQAGDHVADAGDVEQRHADEADVVVEVGAVGEQVRHRLAGEVGVGEHRALGPAGGARGVHDQRGRVVGDVHRRGGAPSSVSRSS